MDFLYTLQPTKIVLYGVSWCGDCRRARSVLTELGVEYLDVDIDTDPQAEAFVRQVNHGNRSAPTIVFPDGTTLTEPDNSTLTRKLKQIHPTA